MDNANDLETMARQAEERAHLAEERARELETRLEVERLARRMGVVDEDAAYRLLELDRVERDETGRAVGVEQALQELIRSRPWLLGHQEGPSPADTAHASPTNPSRDAARRLTREAIRRMTPEQINANWEAIEAALQDRDRF